MLIYILRTRTFLLFFVEGQQRDIGNLDNFETDTRDITDSMTLTTKSSYQYFVIFLKETDS
jgi:hypothetical protein